MTPSEKRSSLVPPSPIHPAPEPGSEATRAFWSEGRRQRRPVLLRDPSRMRHVNPSPIPEDNSKRAMSGPTIRPNACMENTRPTSATPVLAVGVLAHEHRRDGIVAANAQAEHQSSDYQEDEVWGEGGGNRPEDHDHGHGDVDLLAADHVGNTSKSEGANESAQDRRPGDPAGLERAEMPLHRHQSGRRADNEEVIGIGEEADTRNDDGAAVKFARWSFVQKIGDRLMAGAGSPGSAEPRAVIPRELFPVATKARPTLAALGKPQAIER